MAEAYVHKPTLVFDIDGVIACGTTEDVYSDKAGWAFEKCKLIEGADRAVHYFKSIGFKIVLMTARFQDDYEKTYNWLVENRIPFDELRMGKPIAELYIDDNGYRFMGEWDKKTMSEVEFLASRKLMGG